MILNVAKKNMISQSVYPPSVCVRPKIRNRKIKKNEKRKIFPIKKKATPAREENATCTLAIALVFQIEKYLFIIYFPSAPYILSPLFQVNLTIP